MNKLTENKLQQLIKEALDEMITDAEGMYSHGYVLVDDADMAVLGNYNNPDDLQDAINDAKSMAEANPYGSYRVCGCDENGQYDYDETCVFSTFNEGKQRFAKYLNENIKTILTQVISENKDKIKEIIKEANESQKTIGRKQKISEAIDDIASQFIDWALNDSNTQRRIGGPVNALQAMHDYYYNNDDDALYIAAEAFAEAKGIEDAESNIYMILDAAKKAAEYYFNSNPDEEQV